MELALAATEDAPLSERELSLAGGPVRREPSLPSGADRGSQERRRGREPPGVHRRGGRRPYRPTSGRSPPTPPPDVGPRGVVPGRSPDRRGRRPPGDPTTPSGVRWRSSSRGTPRAHCPSATVCSRDCAYGGLTFRLRRQLHSRAADTHPPAIGRRSRGAAGAPVVPLSALATLRLRPGSSRFAPPTGPSPSTPTLEAAEFYERAHHCRQTTPQMTAGQVGRRSTRRWGMRGTGPASTRRRRRPTARPAG